MRGLMAISLMLILVGSTRIWAENQEEGDLGKQHEAQREAGAKKEKGRVFYGTFEFELEQKSGWDSTIEGKTVPGRSIVRTRSTMDLLDDQSFVWPIPKRNESRDADGHGYS